MIFVQSCFAIFVMLWVPGGVYAYFLYKREREEEEELARKGFEVASRSNAHESLYNIRNTCIELMCQLPESRRIKAAQQIAKAFEAKDFGRLEQIRDSIENALIAINKKETA